MADHVWGIGGGAEMMIRDLGMGNGHVEFWFHAGGQTWNNQQDWGYDAGWGYVGGVFQLRTGGGWHHLGTVHIPTSRTVMMRMVGEGLGWPTSDRSVWISRSSRPDPPHTPHSSPGITDAYVGAYLGSDNGAGFTAHEVWFNTNPYNIGWKVLDWHYGTVYGLTKGTTYFFWVRSANAHGWSDWVRGEFRTQSEPDPPGQVMLTDVRQNAVHAEFYGGGDGGRPILEWQIGYSLSPVGPEVLQSGYNMEVVGLQPAKTYYFWARGRNSIGWGPWGAGNAVTLRAGSLVKDAFVWKRALPYVKFNGVWRLAKPYIKEAGVWREVS